MKSVSIDDFVKLLYRYVGIVVSGVSGAPYHKFMKDAQVLLARYEQQKRDSPVAQAEPVACQYAKDVGMPEYRCVDRCQYAAPPAPAPDAQAESVVKRILLDVVPGWDGDGEEVYGYACEHTESMLKRLTDRVNELERAAPPAPTPVAQAEPVATLHDDGCFTWKSDEHRRQHDRQRAGWRMNVYAAPPAPAQGVPEGWALVPVEPTPAMLVAGVAAESNAPTHVQERLTLYAWRAMLAAAPKPEGGA